MKRILIKMLLALIVIASMGMVMTITTIDNNVDNKLMIETEEPLVVEDWMLDENYFN